MDLAEIARLMGASADLSEDVEVESLAYDVSKAMRGSLFFCIKGHRYDGHEFAQRAQSQGAVGIVSEYEVDVSVPVLSVPSSREALNAVSSSFFGDPSKSLRMFGVTGTNGKTTTTYMMESIFRSAGERTGLIGTIETHIGNEVLPGTYAGLGTPESCDLQLLLARMRDVGVTSVALEATSIGLDQGRLDGTRFDVVAFTNLTRDHIEEYHRSFESYYQAKRKLFDPSLARAAVINVDDVWGKRLLGECQVPSVTFGVAAEADVYATDIDIGPQGSSFTAVGAGSKVSISIRLPGRFNVFNALCAIAACHSMSISPDAIVSGLRGLSGVPGRFESIQRGQDFSVVVDYAHTPDSLANILSAARDLAEARLIVVFGCGGDRDRAKRPLMGEAAAKFADVVFATSDNPRSEDPAAILKEIEAGLQSSPPSGGYSIVVDRTQAIIEALRQAARGDVVVIAGKGHETGQEFRDHKIDFDDRVVAGRVLRDLGYDL